MPRSSPIPITRQCPASRALAHTCRRSMLLDVKFASTCLYILFAVALFRLICRNMQRCTILRRSVARAGVCVDHQARATISGQCRLSMGSIAKVFRFGAEFQTIVLDFPIRLARVMCPKGRHPLNGPGNQKPRLIGVVWASVLVAKVMTARRDDACWQEGGGSKH